MSASVIRWTRGLREKTCLPRQVDIFHRLFGVGKAGRDRHNYDWNEILSPAKAKNTVELVDLHTLHSVERRPWTFGTGLDSLWSYNGTIVWPKLRFQQVLEMEREFSFYKFKAVMITGYALPRCLLVQKMSVKLYLRFIAKKHILLNWGKSLPGQGFDPFSIQIAVSHF